MNKIEILVAVRNESENLKIFTEQISKINIKGSSISIVFLEDGSTDDTVNVLRFISKEYDFVKFYSLKNDLGQYGALFWGIHRSNADAVITMDVDGGHPIIIVKEMIKEYLNGYNIVQGHRVMYKRKKMYRSLASYFYNLFFLVFVGLNLVKQNVMFRLMDRSICELFKKNFYWWHFFKINFKKSDGVRIKYISYDAPEREFGSSKYNFLRLVNMSIRAIYSQLSLQRFYFYNFIFLGLIVLCLINSYYVGLAFSILFVILLTIPYLLLRSINPVSRIHILESNAA